MARESSTSYLLATYMVTPNRLAQMKLMQMMKPAWVSILFPLLAASAACSSEPGVDAQGVDAQASVDASDGSTQLDTGTRHDDSGPDAGSPKPAADASLNDGAPRLDGATSPDAAETNDAAMSPDAAPVVLDASDSGIVTFDIVSPARCVHKNGRLEQCVFAPIAVRGTTSAVAPLHSVVTSHYVGNCSSSFALVLQLTTPAATTVLFHVADKTGLIRRLDNGPMTELTINDNDQFATHTAIYDDSCRITADVQLNAPGAI